MNKIYNNLNIENLIKTNWFEQFNIHQKHEILKGLKNNVDVLIYAKTEFDWHQMFEIREGLKDNLDVSLYAKPEYSWKQMNEKRKILLKESTLK